MGKEAGRRRSRLQDKRVTRRGGREASEKRSEIGEKEMQPVMAQLATWWRRSNLVILVTLKKGNYPGVAYVRRGQRKA